MACEHCIKDLGCTIRITTDCNRNCFFCFPSETPQQRKDKPDMKKIKSIIDGRFKEGEFLSLAVSGGEPLIYEQEVYDVLEYVNKYEFIKYKRIYTNGDYMTEDILKRLSQLGLNEIRYSIKPNEYPNFELMKISKKYISNIIVEMPMIPNTIEYTLDLLKKIDETGIDGVNLVEMFFNGYHEEQFKNRNLKIQLYDNNVRDIDSLKPIYEYPIYNSKLHALEVIKMSIECNLKIYINLCTQDTKDLQYSSKKERLAKNNLKKMYIYNYEDQLIEKLSANGISYNLADNKLIIDSIFEDIIDREKYDFIIVEYDVNITIPLRLLDINLVNKIKQDDVFVKDLIRKVEEF